jgi:hypothetical protein
VGFGSPAAAERRSDFALKKMASTLDAGLVPWRDATQAIA